MQNPFQHALHKTNTMKKIKYILPIALGILLSVISCSDFLEEEIEDAVNINYLYTTQDGLESGVVGLYNLQRDHIWTNQKGGLFLYTSHDLAQVRTFNDAQVYGTEYNPLRFPDNLWEENYRIIDRANALIQNAPKVDMDPDERNTILAQARYFRAQAHFDLIRYYQNILLDTTATTPENAFEEEEYAPANPKDVYDLIDTDLDFAIAQLPYDVAPGRAGQGIARMIRAESAMWQQDWAEAAAQCDAIIENGNYNLVDISEVFGQDVNHSEAIYTRQYDELSGGSASLAGGSSHSMAGYFTNRYYEMSSEMIADAALGGNTFSWTVPNNYLKSLFDAENDQRLQYYFWPQTFDMSYIVNNPDSPNFGQPLAESEYPDNYRQYHWSLKKYFDLEKPVRTTQGYKDIIVYRLAETYLLGAEAHWRNTGNGMDAKAMEYMGLVRERAGLENVSSIDQRTILDERARELSFENHRWFTLKRMGVLVEQVNQHLVLGSNSGNLESRQMEPYMVNLPIPQNQIDLLVTFPQNEGY